MAKYTIEDTTLTAIADAIRSKEGSSELIAVLEMAQRILDIQTGIDTSDATATAARVPEGDTFYARGEKHTGELKVYENRTIELALDLDPRTINMTGAYFNTVMNVPGALDVLAEYTTVITGTTEKDILEYKRAWVNGVCITGTMPAYDLDNNDVEWTLTNVPTGTGNADMVVKLPEGHYEAGSYNVGTLAMYKPTDVTPGAADIEIPGGAWFMNGFTIAGDANLIAANIKSGVSIFGVAGSLESVSLNTCTVKLSRSASAAKISYVAYMAKDSSGNIVSKYDTINSNSCTLTCLCNSNIVIQLDGSTYSVVTRTNATQLCMYSDSPNDQVVGLFKITAGASGTTTLKFG